MATFSEIAFKMVFEVSDAVKALESIRDRIGKDIPDAYKTADAAQAKYAQQLEKLAQEEEKRKQQTIKTAEQESKLRQQLAKEAEAAAKRIADAEKKAEADRKKSAQETANFKKKVDEELRKTAMADSEKILELERRKGEVAASGADKNSKAVRRILEEEARLKADMAKRESAMIEQLYREKLATVEKGSAEWVKLEQERIDKVTAAEKKANAESEKADKAQAGKKGRHFDEVAENFSTLTDSLTSGNIAGAAAGIGQMFGDMGGKIGGVVGVVADQVFGLIGGLTDLAKQAKVVDAEWNRFSVSIQNTGADLTVGQINNIEIGLRALQRPIGMSEEELAKLSAGVANFAPPDMIVKTTDGILNLSRIAKDVPIDELAGKVGQFQSALGSGGSAADIMAEAMMQLQGVTKNAGDAAGEIANVYGKAGLAIKNTKQAASESATVFTALAKSGFEAGEAASTSEGLFEGFAEAVKDPEMKAAITKSLPEGISLMDAGLEAGNESVVKFAKTLVDMGEGGKKVAAEIGGPAALGLQKMIDASQKGTLDLDKLSKSFDNVGGAAQRTAALLTPVSQMQEELANQRAEDAMTNLGRAFEGLADTGAGFLNDVLGGLAQMGGPIAGFFVDTAVEAERAKQAYEAVRDQAQAFVGLADELNALEGPEFVDQITANMDVLEASVPGTASEIQHLIDTMAQPGTAEYAAQIAEIKTLMTEAKDIKLSEEWVAQQDALLALQVSMADLRSEADGTFDSWSGFMATLTEIGGAITGQMNAAQTAANNLRKTFSEAVESVQKRLQELRKERDALKEKQASGDISEEEVARLHAVNTEIAEANVQLGKTRANQASTMQQTLNATKSAVELTSNITDKEERRAAILLQLAPIMANQPDVQKQVLNNLDAIMAGEEMRVDANGKIVASMEKQDVAAEQQKGIALDMAGFASLRAQETNAVAEAEERAGLVALRASNDVRQAELELAAIRDPDERIAAEQHLADVKAGASAEEMAAQKEIADAKIAQEKLALLELDKQANAINEQIRQLDAVLQAGTIEQEQLKKIAEQHANINQIIAERKQAEETGEAGETQVLSLDLSGGKEALEQYRESLVAARDATEKEREKRLNAIETIQQEIEGKDLDRQIEVTNARVEAEEKAKKAVEDKAKAEDKSADAVRKAAETSARASATQSKNASKASSEVEKARKKAIEDEKKRNEELRKALVQAVQAAQAQFNQLFQKAADQSAAAAQRLGRAMDELTFIAEASATQEEATARANETEEQRKARLQAAVEAATKKRDDAQDTLNDATYGAAQAGLESFAALKTLTLVTGPLVRNLHTWRRNLESGFQPGAAQRNVAREIAPLFNTLIPNLNREARRAAEEATKSLRESLGLNNFEALLNAMKEGTIPKDKLGDLIDALAKLNETSSGQVTSLQAPVQTAGGNLDTARTELQTAIDALNAPVETAVDATNKIAASVAAGLGAADALLRIGAEAEHKFTGVGESMGRIVRLISEGKTDGAFAGILSALGTDLTGALSSLVDLRKQFEAVQAAATAEMAGYDEQIRQIGLSTTLTKEEKAAQIDLINARKKALDDQQKAVQFVLDKATMEARFAQEAWADGYAKALAETEQAVGEAQSNITQAMADEEQKRIDNLKQSESERVRIQIESERKAVEERIKARQMELEDLQKKLAEQNDMKDMGAAQTAEQIRAGEEELAGLQNTLNDLDTTSPFRLGEAAIADMNKAAENITKVMGGVAGAIDTATEFIGAMREAGDALDVVDAGADLAQKIGSVLMTAPPPLNIAGAVLAGAGLIAKAVTGIIRLFQSEELTQKQQAENEIARQERINALYDKRKELLEKTIALGDVTVDQAFEQLQAQKQLMQMKLIELGMGRNLMEMDADRLAMTLERNAAESKGLNDTLAQAQTLLELGDRSDMRDFLKSQGVDVGVNSKRAMEEFINGLEAQILLLENDTENLEAVMEMQQTILDLEKAIIDERLRLNDLRIRLGADERKVLEENEQLLRDQLDAQLAALIDANSEVGKIAKSFGVFDEKSLSKLSGEELKEFLAALAEMPDSQLSGPILDMVDGWLAGVDAVDSFNDSMSETEDLFDKLKTRLGLLKDLGRISETEFQDQMLTLLEERLAFLDAEREAMIEAGASAGELLDNEIERLNIEKEIKGLLEGENAEMMKSDRILTKLVRDRGRLLAQLRVSGGGTLGAAGQAQLQAATDAAVARMREIGATDDEIAKFLASLPQYEKGGYIPNGGPKMLHAGEFVLPAPVVNEIGRDELERLMSNSPSNLTNSLAGRMITQGAAAGNIASQINLGGITINISVGGSVSDSGAKVMGESIGSTVAAQLNKLIQEGNVRVNRG